MLVAPGVAHGILEVAEQQARPATSKRSSPAVSLRLLCTWLMAQRSNVRRACIQKARQSGKGPCRSSIYPPSGKALIGQRKSLPLASQRSVLLVERGARRTAWQSDSEQNRDEDSTKRRYVAASTLASAVL